MINPYNIPTSLHYSSNLAPTNTHAYIPRPSKGWGFEINAERPSKAAFLKYQSFPQVVQYIEGCVDRYFVTLTTKRKYDAVALTAEISKTLHRVNTKLFGNFYSRKNLIRLATFTIHERSINDGLHAHMLVGVPNGSLNAKAFPCKISPPELIVSTWVSQDENEVRHAKGQDYKEVSNFNGVLGYITKTINKIEDIENVDVLNTTYPFSEQLPLPRQG